MYKQDLSLPKSTRIFRDTTASSPPVWVFLLWCLPHARAGAGNVEYRRKMRLWDFRQRSRPTSSRRPANAAFRSSSSPATPRPSSKPKAPEGMVKVYPRRIDLENTERLKVFRAARSVVETLSPTSNAAFGHRKRDSWRMAERLIFLTGHLARHAAREGCWPASSDAGFDWSIFDVGVKVAALMTEAIISPPRCHVRCRPIGFWCPAAAALTSTASAPTSAFRFERGPEELKDLPAYFGQARPRSRSFPP